MSFGDEMLEHPDAHEYVNVRDRPGALDRELERLRRSGRRVLDFWRSRGRWVFKLMVGASVERERD